MDACADEPGTSVLWIHKICRVVEEFLHLGLSHRYLLEMVRGFDGVYQELSSELVVRLKKIGRVKGRRSHQRMMVITKMAVVAEEIDPVKAAFRVLGETHPSDGFIAVPTLSGNR
jgi:hypothetical protein